MAPFPRLSSQMQEQYLDNFQSWVWNNTRQSKGFFEGCYGTKSVWALKELMPDWDLLRAAAHFWDVRRHVYNFSYNEITPTFEDFRAILGGPETEQLVLPYAGGMATVEKLVSLFGISAEEAYGMLILNTDYVDISGLPDKFVGAEGSIFTWDAFALCSIATLFIFTSLGVCHHSVLDLVRQCRNGGDMVPLVLGETFLGIGRMATGSRYMWGGSL